MEKNLFAVTEKHKQKGTKEMNEITIPKDHNMKKSNCIEQVPFVALISTG
jgi:hypothetical protein